MTNKVTFLFIAQDKYTAVAKQVAQATQSMREKFAGMSAAASKAAINMKELMDRARKAGEAMVKVGKNISLYVSAPAALFAATSIRAFDQEAVALAKVENAVKSTGGAAKLSVAELVAEASKLQSETIFGDETILNSATAQLLTFTNIAGEQFKGAQRAAMDLATMLDGDLKSASIQLGKALNDPVANLSALSRSGIQFTKEQKELINALWGAGMQAEAQTVILKELNKQYGGTAQAAAKAGLGPLRQLGNAFSDFQEKIGSALLDMFSPLIVSLKSLTEWLGTLSPRTTKIIAVMLILAAALGPLIIGLGVLMSMIPFITAGFAAIGAAITFATGPIGMIIVAIGLVIAAAVYMYSEFEIVRDVVEAVAGAIAATFRAVVSGVMAAWSLVSGIYDKMSAIKTSMEESVTGAMDKVADFMNFGGSMDVNASSRTDINVNLRAPQGAVDSVKSRTNGNVPGMNVGVNMVPG